MMFKTCFGRRKTAEQAEVAAPTSKVEEGSSTSRRNHGGAGIDAFATNLLSGALQAFIPKDGCAVLISSLFDACRTWGKGVRDRRDRRSTTIGGSAAANKEGEEIGISTSSNHQGGGDQIGGVDRGQCTAPMVDAVSTVAGNDVDEINILLQEFKALEAEIQRFTLSMVGSAAMANLALKEAKDGLLRRARVLVLVLEASDHVFTSIALAEAAAVEKASSIAAASPSAPSSSPSTPSSSPSSSIDAERDNQVGSVATTQRSSSPAPAETRREPIVVSNVSTFPGPAFATFSRSSRSSSSMTSVKLPIRGSLSAFCGANGSHRPFIKSPTSSSSSRLPVDRLVGRTHHRLGPLIRSVVPGGLGSEAISASVGVGGSPALGPPGLGLLAPSEVSFGGGRGSGLGIRGISLDNNKVGLFSCPPRLGPAVSAMLCGGESDRRCRSLRGIVGSLPLSSSVYVLEARIGDRLASSSPLSQAGSLPSTPSLLKVARPPPPGLSSPGAVKRAGARVLESLADDDLSPLPAKRHQVFTEDMETLMKTRENGKLVIQEAMVKEALDYEGQNPRSIAFQTKLGKGAFSCAVECTKKQGYNRRCAIKVTALCEKGKSIKHHDVEQNCRGALREVQALYKIIKANIPNIVKMHAIGIYGGSLCVELQLAEAGSLSSWIDSKIYLSEQETCYLIVRLCCSVEQLAVLDLMHQDIKPEMMDEYGNLVVADFNCVSRLITDKAGNKCPLNHAGDLLYKPLEVLKNLLPYTYQTDMYSAVMAGLTSAGFGVNDVALNNIMGNASLNWSMQGKEIVSQMLAGNPKDRAGFGELMSSEWVSMWYGDLVNSSALEVSPASEIPPALGIFPGSPSLEVLPLGFEVLPPGLEVSLNGLGVSFEVFAAPPGLGASPPGLEGPSAAIEVSPGEGRKAVGKAVYELAKIGALFPPVTLAMKAQAKAKGLAVPALSPAVAF